MLTTEIPEWVVKDDFARVAHTLINVNGRRAHRLTEKVSNKILN